MHTLLHSVADHIIIIRRCGKLLRILRYRILRCGLVVVMTVCESCDPGLFIRHPRKSEGIELHIRNEIRLA